jgi:mRNA interferase MazF
MEVSRGDIVTAVVPGDYGGRPRPAVIVQSDLFNPTHSSLILCPITRLIVDAPLFRIDLLPSAVSGLAAASQIMADKVIAIRRDRIRGRIGRLSAAELAALDRAIACVLGLPS